MSAAGDPTIDLVTVHQVIDGEDRWSDVPRAALSTYTQAGWLLAERPPPAPAADEAPPLAPARPALPAQVAPPSEADLAFAAEQSELTAAAAEPDEQLADEPAVDGDREPPTTTSRTTRTSPPQKER